MIIDVYRNMDIPMRFSRKKIISAISPSYDRLRITSIHYNEIMDFIMEEKGIIATIGIVSGKREITKSSMYGVRDIFLITATKSDIAKLKLNM